MPTLAIIILAVSGLLVIASGFGWTVASRMMRVSTRRMPSAHLYAAYWNASTPQQEREAYAALRAHGMPPAYGEGG